MFAALVADIDIFLESVPTVLADVVCYLKYFNYFYNGSKVNTFKPSETKTNKLILFFFCLFSR